MTAPPSGTTGTARDVLAYIDRVQRSSPDVVIINQITPTPSPDEMLARYGCPHRPAWLVDGRIACGYCGQVLR